MKIKSLIETNPYLKDPVMRRMLVERSVRTSCAVEGIAPPTDKILSVKIIRRKNKKTYKSRG